MQVRDLCQRMSAAKVLHQPSALGPDDDGRQGSSAQYTVQGSGGAAQVVLVVLGRQYVHTMEALWADERSALWRGDVPQDKFAPSSLEPHDLYGPGVHDPDVEHGGSRPVGQVSRGLGGGLA